MPKLLIAGAGAAGLFAAGRALRAGCEVALVEHMQRPGKKLAITGKGRCNLTNACDEREFLQNVRHNPRFLYSAVYALPPQAVMDFFADELGLPLKTERGRRVFPLSDRAEDVVEALKTDAKDAEFIQGRAMEVLRNPEGAAAGLRLEDGRMLYADAVLLATGGLSYPLTGSTGLGYKMAEQLGHHIVPPAPSLVALVEKGTWAGRMQGLSLRNVRLNLLQNGRQVYSEQGEMLFTHFGVSGPLTLSASAYVDDPKKQKYTLQIDLKPALSPEALEKRMQRDFDEFAAKDAANSLDKLLPAAMRPVMLERWGIDPRKKAGQITRAERQRLLALVKGFGLEIAAKGDLAHAVITAGGVDTREVNPKTMESRLCKGLYFAGEILDVDAYTGGYNLQIAWCTAHAAACAVAACRP